MNDLSTIAMQAPSAADGAGDPILRVKNIETCYGPIVALRGVSLDVHAGRIVTILGGNGAGKTTILKTISGVLLPSKGQVQFCGESIEGEEPSRVARRGIGHVPEGREVFPLMTVEENLRVGAYRRRDAAGVARDLELVIEYFPRLKDRFAHPAGFLSGGEQQMLAIGRALLSRPRLLLLDEPSLGLSPILVEEIFGIVRRLNEEQGLTILLVEQNARAALELAHDGYVLELGRVVMADTCARLMESEDVREFYLGLKAEAVRGQRRWKKRKIWR